jgi:uncharacterized protein YjlB
MTTQPELHRFPAVTDVPLVVYRGVLGKSADACERLFAKHGWSGGWRAGIYGHHHYHATTHEVLGIIDGRADVRFGGEDGPVVSIAAGDVVIIPAGVAHCREKGEVLAVGAYPDGHHPDVNRGAPRQRIVGVARPPRDPMFGTDGAVVRDWPA